MQEISIRFLPLKLPHSSGIMDTVHKRAMGEKKAECKACVCIMQMKSHLWRRTV